MPESEAAEDVLGELLFCRRADDADDADDAEVRVEANDKAKIGRDSVLKTGPDADKTLDMDVEDEPSQLVEHAVAFKVSCLFLRALVMSMLHTSGGEGIMLSLFQIAIGSLFLDQAKLLM